MVPDPLDITHARLLQADDLRRVRGDLRRPADVLAAPLQGLQMFHVMTRPGTTASGASAGSGLVMWTPFGALGPTSSTQAAISAPASRRAPVPVTFASSEQRPTPSCEFSSPEVM